MMVNEPYTSPPYVPRNGHPRAYGKVHFTLFGVDGLFFYDPLWRIRKTFAEFEPVSLADRELTEAERKAFKARETNIEFIVGKPGGGKSMTATKMVIEELLHGDRPIVTNLALNISRLQEYIHELGGKACVADRVRLLTHEEVFTFFCIRGYSVVLVPPSRAEDLFDYSESQNNPESAGGVFYVIDECHNYFSTKSKIDEDSPVFKWASQHRKLKDYCYFVTQSIENTHAKIRRLAQQFNYIRNLRKETFRGFRRGDGFERTVYLHIPTSTSSIPIDQKPFKLDCAGLASCYFTAGGVGVNPSGNADGGFQRKGLHMRWIWVAFFVAVLGGVSLIFVIPWLLGKGAKKMLERDGPAVVANAKIDPKIDPPRPVASKSRSSVDERPSVGLAGSVNPDVPVYATGYVLARGLINVCMSDGTIRTERDTELQRVERNSITLSGVKIFFKGLPRLASAGLGVPEAVRSDSSGVTLPASSGSVLNFASTPPGWRLDPDGVMRSNSAPKHLGD
ncbi:MAG: zonular occludens toxin domain-containing protein [Opitutaceae bacterium]|jgi:hypothetical protein